MRALDDETMETYPTTVRVAEGAQDDVEGNSDEESEALALVEQWWGIDSEAKDTIQEEFEEIYKLYTGDHWALKYPGSDPLRSSEEMVGRPNSVENVTFSLIEGEKAEFMQEFELIDAPAEKNDEAAAQKMTKLKRFILYKNEIPRVYSEWLHNFFWYGTGVWGPRWDPDWISGQGPHRTIGDIRLESIHPQVLFPDARCGADINDGYRLHKAVYRPIEYVRQHYPERSHLLRGETESPDDILGVVKALSDGGTSSVVQDGVVRLIETWYIGEPLVLGKDEEGEEEKDEGVGLHVIWWTGERDKVYLRHRNYMYFEPGETPYFPFFFGQCYPRENNPFGYGEAHYLKNQQIMLNKESEIVLEGSAMHALGQTLVKEGAVSEEQQMQIDQYGNIPGWWVWVDEPQNIVRMRGEGVPGSVLSDVSRRYQAMETIIGRFDITQGKTPGSVTAFRALSLLAERAQVRLRSKERMITTCLEMVSRFMSKMIAQFYNEKRVYRLLGETAEHEYGVFNPDSDLHRVWVKDTNDVFPKDRWEPDEGMKPEEDYEYFIPEFDTHCTVSRSLPTDRLFFLEMSKELMAAQLITPQIFWHVLEHGRFPTWSAVAEEMEETVRKAQELEQEKVAVQRGEPAPPEEAAPQQQQPGSSMPPLSLDELASMLPPEQRQELANLPPEVQGVVLEEMMKNMQGGGQGDG